MKLIRGGPPGKENPGILLEDGTRLDAYGFVSDYDEAFFGNDGISRLKTWLSSKRTPASQVPVFRPAWPAVCRAKQIICIGLNFRDHDRESKKAIPKEPFIFFKSTSSVVGPNDDVVTPKGGQKVNWELELAVVIGKQGGYIEQGPST